MLSRFPGMIRRLGKAASKNEVTEKEIADNAVTLNKLEDGTAGDVLLYDASGNPIRLAAGNDNQILTSQGAGAAAQWLNGTYSNRYSNATEFPRTLENVWTTEDTFTIPFSQSGKDSVVFFWVEVDLNLIVGTNCDFRLQENATSSVWSATFVDGGKTLSRTSAGYATFQGFAGIWPVATGTPPITLTINLQMRHQGGGGSSQGAYKNLEVLYLLIAKSE